MKKKTIIIISIIFTIISIIYLLLQYFGMLRYASLYLYSPETYIKDYKKLDKIDKNNRVIISLTTTPEKMKNIIPVINSLLDQTVKVDLISIVVPYGSQYKLPKNLTDAVTLFRSSENNGDLTPLLSSLMREEESTTKIIILGDANIYGKDFIETLIEESNKNPQKIIYINNKNSIKLNKGVIFKTTFFDEDFLEIDKNVNPNKWVDNYFKNHPKKKIVYSGNYRTM